ncbi:MAG: DUF2254 domain-containing protein [Acidobacteriaceae bacterium]
MRIRLAQWRDTLTTGFWFVPTLMAALAVVVAFLLVAMDQRLDPGTEGTLGWAYSGGAEGARSLLSTIAGSMITAASVTFSLASVALSIASQQYGSRVLRNFMRDRITQVLLGTFVSTFIYCVLVVRTIRGNNVTSGFVPAIAITVAIALSVISLVLLIFFIHHISSSIQASSIVNMIGKEMMRSIPELYPSEAGSPLPVDEAAESETSSSWAELTAARSGYVQAIDMDSAMELAGAGDAVLRLVARPGDYVVSGSALALVYPAGAATPEMTTGVNSAWLLGPQRTPAQDVRFTFQQLSEVTIRALSPGINDPFTAIYAIDRLSEGLSLLAERDPVSPLRRDEKGAWRLIAETTRFPEVAETVFQHIAPYARQDASVLRRLLHTVDVVSGHVRRQEDAACLRLQRAMVQALLRENQRENHQETGSIHADGENAET